jgi:arylsulfatase A-like enzyme
MSRHVPTRVVAPIALAIASAMVGLAVGCSRAAAPRNVVIVTLDTTRADRLSPYGFMNVAARDRALAREGVVFDRASTVAPLTLTAHTSLFTGLLPPHHGVRDNADAPLRRRRRLAALCRARVQTAFVAPSC